MDERRIRKASVSIDGDKATTSGHIELISSDTDNFLFGLGDVLLRINVKPRVEVKTETVEVDRLVQKPLKPRGIIWDWFLVSVILASVGWFVWLGLYITGFKFPGLKDLIGRLPF